jgi:hypothetical protein
MRHGADRHSSLVTAVRCDELVENLDLGVEQNEIALMVGAVLAS